MKKRSAVIENNKVNGFLAVLYESIPLIIKTVRKKIKASLAGNAGIADSELAIPLPFSLNITPQHDVITSGSILRKYSNCITNSIVRIINAAARSLYFVLIKG